MVRERVAEDVYVFTSELYAQVNAGAVVGPEWSVLIDTLALPEETLEIRRFLEVQLQKPVRYLVNTHYHADHTNGNCFFPGAVIVAHARCRQMLERRGRAGLEGAKMHSRELRGVELVLPDLVFERGKLSLRIGKRTLDLISMPGHSPDGIGVLVTEERVLFSGDAMMPVPYLVDGDPEALTATMKHIARLKLEGLVQGHGEVILRGEVAQATRSNVNYVMAIGKHAHKALRRRDPAAYLAGVDIDSVGKSRILLNGLAEELHQRNLFALYQRARSSSSRGMTSKGGR